MVKVLKYAIVVGKKTTKMPKICRIKFFSVFSLFWKEYLYKFDATTTHFVALKITMFHSNKKLQSQSKIELLILLYHNVHVQYYNHEYIIGGVYSV